MTFYQASTNSATPSADAMSFIETGLSAHAGWALVNTDSTTLGGATIRVWECLGSQNAYGQNFYVYLIKDTAGAGSFSVRLSEGYNTATKNLIRPATAFWSGTTIPVSSTDYSIGNGTEYSLALGPGSVGAAFAGAISFSASVAIDHFLVVSKSFIAYSNNSAGTAHGSFYAGNFDPIYSSTYNPVVLWFINGSIIQAASVTRFPNCVSIPAYVGGDAFFFPATFPDGYLTTLSIAEKFRGLTEATSVMITGAAGYVGNLAAGLFASGGGLRGSMPSSVMLMVAEGTAPRNGDFFTVGTTDYFRCGLGAAGGYSNMVASPNQVFYIAKTATY